MFGWIVCWWKGKHIRGKLLRQDQAEKVFGCPRCGRERSYKVKNAPAV